MIFTAWKQEGRDRDRKNSFTMTSGDFVIFSKKNSYSNDSKYNYSNYFKDLSVVVL